MTATANRDHAITEARPTRKGLLNIDGWAGRTSNEVEIIGETPKRYRIRAITQTKLAGRARWIEAGEEALVPKYAITITEARPTTEAQDDAAIENNKVPIIYDDRGV